MVSSFQQAVRSRFQEFRNDRRNANTLIFKMGGYKNIMCIEARANRKWLLLFHYLLDSPELFPSWTLRTDFLWEEVECRDCWLRRSSPLIIVVAHWYLMRVTNHFDYSILQYSVMHSYNCNSLGGHKRRTSYNSLDYFLKVYSFVLVKERNSSQTSFYVFLL